MSTITRTGRKTTNRVEALKFHSLDPTGKLVRRHPSFYAAARFVRRKIASGEYPSMTVLEEETQKRTFYDANTQRAERGAE